MSQTLPMNVLENVRGVLLPGVFQLVGESGVRSADIFVDHVEDCLILGVSHRLVTRCEIDDGTWKRVFYPRAAADFGLPRRPSGELLVADRKSLSARAAAAAKGKPRRKPGKVRCRY